MVAPVYRKEQFPNYVLTNDTSVVPFKSYYRLSGTTFARVLEPGDVNPKEQGFYEFQEKHNQEYRCIVEEYQLNNLATFCVYLVNKLLKFPKQILERKTTVTPASGEPYTIDRTPEMNDTSWDEVGGTLVVEFPTVCFDTNYKLVERIPKMMSDSISKYSYYLETEEGQNKYKELWTDLMSGVDGNLYDQCTLGNIGYHLYPKTFGDSSRTADVYTLVYEWTHVDYQTMIYFLEGLLNRMEQDPEKWTDIYDTVKESMNLFKNAARTMLFISRHMLPLVVVDRSLVKIKE